MPISLLFSLAFLPLLGPSQPGIWPTPRLTTLWNFSLTCFQFPLLTFSHLPGLWNSIILYSFFSHMSLFQMVKHFYLLQHHSYLPLHLLLSSTFQVWTLIISFLSSFKNVKNPCCPCLQCLLFTHHLHCCPIVSCHSVLIINQLFKTNKQKTLSSLLLIKSKLSSSM